MTRLVDRIARIMPSHGVLATEAGKRVVLGVAVITGAGMLAAAIAGGAVLAIAGATGTLQDATVHSMLLGMLGGAIVLVVSFLLLPLVGRFAGIASDVRLLELSNPGSPLLRDLMTAAPGTYSHSIMTGSLAERAALEIGANGLLARVGAYYHDIGKSVRPNFFVENQAGVGNPHDIASPAQSAFVITAHVRDGAELAAKGNLPPEVVDIIRQHHGTSLVTCFYEKARKGDGAVLEADFRYDGERPTTREAALVMLADVAEAAARAVHDPSQERLLSTVRRVADGKVADGQLVDSNLSEADIDRTVRVYARMLASVYHTRIEYPEDAEARRS
ncbi:MAG: HDIG domain-containing protein [Coriobacteriia bacterium]|nr:HDIG domain-containing protein [Coriobacteriia bacterium]